MKLHKAFIIIYSSGFILFFQPVVLYFSPWQFFPYLIIETVLLFINFYLAALINDEIMIAMKTNMAGLMGHKQVDNDFGQWPHWTM